MEIQKELSGTIMVSNLIGTILVIAIHYDSKKMIAVSSGADWNYLFQEFLTNGVARAAVPFFAMISGFFLSNAVRCLADYLNTLKKRTGTLLVPYLIGSFLIFISSTLLKLMYAPDRLSDLEPIEIVKCILVQPVSIQYWFLRDLMIATIISPAVLNINKIIHYPSGLVLALLWLFDIQPFPVVGGWYLINIEVLFFFWLGGHIYRNPRVLYSIMESRDVVKYCLLSAWFSLIWIRVLIDPDISVWYVNDYTIVSVILYKLAIFIGVFSLMQISGKFKKSKILISLSGLTFFAYLYHVAPLNYFLKNFAESVVDEEFAFYVQFPIATGLVFLSAHITSSRLVSIYTILTGGRTPEKARRRMHATHSFSGK